MSNSKSTGQRVVTLEGTATTTPQSLLVDAVYINHLVNDGAVDIIFTVNGEDFTLKPDEKIVNFAVDVTKLFFRTDSGTAGFRFLGKSGVGNGLQVVSLEATANLTEARQVFECGYINHLINDGVQPIEFSIDTEVAEDVNVFTLQPSEWIENLPVTIYSLSYKVASGTSAFRVLGVKR